MAEKFAVIREVRIRVGERGGGSEGCIYWDFRQIGGDSWDIAYS